MPEINPIRAAKPRRKSLAGAISAALLGFCFLFFFCAFAALGVWQVKRLFWKENLIATANAHTQMAAIPAPPPADWGKIRADGDPYNYRKVTARGILRNDKEILVKASVLLSPLDETGGAGFWVMTPLAQEDGTFIFINRGFVPPEKRGQNSRLQSLPQGETEINGLLRLSEGAGHLFNKNDPQHNIWYNRDLPALAAAAGLMPAQVAPYFIDADKTPNLGGFPRGGLTVVQFPNNHLVYAITWFSGALGVLIAAALVWRNRKQ